MMMGACHYPYLFTQTCIHCAATRRGSEITDEFRIFRQDQIPAEKTIVLYGPAHMSERKVFLRTAQHGRPMKGHSFDRRIEAEGQGRRVVELVPARKRVRRWID